MAPIVTERKPKPGAVKNQEYPSATSFSRGKLDMPSPTNISIHPPSKSDLNSLVLPQTSPNADKMVSFSESITSSEYVLSSTENTAIDDINPYSESDSNIQPIVAKPLRPKYEDTLLGSTNESLSTDKFKKKNQVKSRIVELTTNKCNGKKSCLRSVLVNVRNKSSKKSVSWRQDNDLEEISYFEQYTEIESLPKNFNSLKIHDGNVPNVQRENCIAVQNIDAVDNMESKTPWRNLDNALLVEVPDTENIKHGIYSEVKTKQTLQEPSVLPVIYLTENMVPDSPENPDKKVPFSCMDPEPCIIPLKENSGNTSIVYNHAGVSWSEPIGDQPPVLEVPVVMNSKIPIPYTMIMQSQFPRFGGNQMNLGMRSKNVMVKDPRANNMCIPPGPTMMNNQMFKGDRMSRQLKPLPSTLPQQKNRNLTPVQNNQYMGIPRPTMHHN